MRWFPKAGIAVLTLQRGGHGKQEGSSHFQTHPSGKWYNPASYPPSFLSLSGGDGAILWFIKPKGHKSEGFLFLLDDCSFCSWRGRCGKPPLCVGDLSFSSAPAPPLWFLGMMEMLQILLWWWAVCNFNLYFNTTVVGWFVSFWGLSFCFRKKRSLCCDLC